MRVLRWLLAALLVAAGGSHLTWGRRGYRIVVPDWATRMLHTDKDAVVVGSGAVEIMLGATPPVKVGSTESICGWFACCCFLVIHSPGWRHRP